MAFDLRQFFSSIGVRLILALSTTVGAVLAVHAVLDMGYLTRQFEGVLHADARRTSDLIRRAAHDGMLQNRLDDVQVLLELMAQGPGVAAIRVYDKGGTVVLSGHKEEIGKQILLVEAPCLSCHGEGQPVTVAFTESTALITNSGGDRVLRRLSAIENEPSCANATCHAHVDDGPLLGVLDFEISLAPLDAASRSIRNQVLATSALLVLITGLICAVVVRQLVHLPVVGLIKATQRVAAGDLETRTHVPGRHELARLAEAFNQMTNDLEEARSEIRDWSQRLEEKVLERTQELHRTQRQILHMEKMASLGKLAATVAHELNNPISGILTYARLVERSIAEQSLPAETAAELERYLGLIQKECARSGDVVSNLLLFAHRSSPEMGQTDIGEIVERAIMLVKHHAEIHDVDWHCQIRLDDPKLHAAAGQLQQALVALCINAVEAMAGAGDQGGELTVTVDGDGEEVCIRVADTGVGMPPEIQAHIFEPFFSTKDETSGVGLGLAVVYGIVQLHAGSIDVHSEPGRGTTFVIRLPRRPPPRDLQEFAARTDVETRRPTGEEPES